MGAFYLLFGLMGIALTVQGAMAVGVELADLQGQFLTILGRLAALVDRADQLQSGVFVGNMPGPFGLGRQSFADIVQQAGPAYGQWLLVFGALAQHAEYMFACIYFRVMGGRLRHAKQCVDLGQQLAQRATVA